MTGSEPAGGSTFRTSTFSGGGGCVAVGRLSDGRVGVQHSRPDEDDHTLVFTEHEWQAFIKGVKAGQFDSP